MKNYNSLRQELIKNIDSIGEKLEVAELINEKNKKLTSDLIEKENEVRALKKIVNSLEQENEEWVEEISHIESKKGKSKYADARIVGITNLEKRKDEAIFDAINYFGKKCPYCDKDLYEGNIRSKIEIDHFFPIAKGGQDFPWNILPTCKQCNRKKRDILPRDFLAKGTYLRIKNYLDSVKSQITNSINGDLQDFEIIIDVFKTNLDQIERVNCLNDLLISLNIIKDPTEIINQLLAETMLIKEIKEVFSLRTVLIEMKKFLDWKHQSRESRESSMTCVDVIDFKKYALFKKSVERYGLGVHQKSRELVIAQNHHEIMKILETGKGYHRQLEQHKNVLKISEPIRIDKTTKRCTVIKGFLVY